MNKSKNSAKKIGVVLGNVVLVLLLAVGIALTISVLPIKGNYRVLSVVSGSMEPTIDTGSLIIVKPADSYGNNDIITFRSTDSSKENDNTTHRIISVEQVDGFTEYRTKGDANEVGDSNTVKPSQIIGKHVFSVEYLGYFLMYIKTLPGLLVLIIVPAAIIIYEEIKKIRTQVKRIIIKKASKSQKYTKSKSSNQTQIS